jgi:uncharacterized protein (TIGR02996 family)
MTDADFLPALAEHPGEADRRLVYADWLEEQGDKTSLEKAEFLRRTVEVMQEPAGLAEGPVRERLQALAAGLDPDWLAVVSELMIENCRRKIDEVLTSFRQAPTRPKNQPVFEFICDLKWTDLQPTDDPKVRICLDCRRKVHYCDRIREAREHAWNGHCIAIDLGVIRRAGDLQQPGAVVGRPSVEALLYFADQEMPPDPVSEAREKRKNIPHST